MQYPDTKAATNRLKESIDTFTLSRQQFIVLFVLLVLLNIVIRIPSSHGEMGSDSFLIHGLANSLSVEGKALWIVHPFSVMGLYPMAYPSAVPYFLSIVSSITGLPLENTIFVVSLLLGVLSLFTSYILFKYIFDNNVLILLSCYLYSIAPMFVAYTSWTITTRGAALVFMPMVIYFLLKIINPNESSKKRDYVMFFLFNSFSLMIHRAMDLIVVLVFFALIIKFIRVPKKMTIVSNWIKRRNTLFLTVLFFVVSLAFYSIYILLVYYSGIPFFKMFQFGGRSYSSFLFSYSTHPIIVLFNSILLIITKVNLFVFFMFFGILRLVQKIQEKKCDTTKKFLLLSMVLLPSLFFLRIYVLMLYLPILITLLVYGIDYCYNSLCKFSEQIKGINIVFIILLVIVSLAWTSFLMYKWTYITSDVDRTITTQENRQISYFLSQYENEVALTNNPKLGTKIMADSQVKVFPVSIYEFLTLRLVPPENIEPVNIFYLSRATLSFARSQEYLNLRRLHAKLANVFEENENTIVCTLEDYSMFDKVLIYNPDNKNVLLNNTNPTQNQIYSSTDFQIIEISS